MRALPEPYSGKSCGQQALCPTEPHILHSSQSLRNIGLKIRPPPDKKTSGPIGGKAKVFAKRLCSDKFLARVKFKPHLKQIRKTILRVRSKNF